MAFLRLVLLLPLSVALSAAGCSPRIATPGTSASPVFVTAESAPLSLALVHPARRTIHWSVEQPGTIRPFEETPLIAKLSGYVSRVEYDIGDIVEGGGREGWFGNIREGTILAEISIPELLEEIEQKKSLVRQAELEIELAKKTRDVFGASAKVAETGITEALAGQKRATADYDRWKIETNRIDELVRRSVIDRQTGDETRSQFTAAAAMVDQMTARTASMRSALVESEARFARSALEIQTAESRLKTAQADLRKSQVMRDYTDIRAPFDGTITARNVHRGHFLQSSNGRSEPIFTIARLDPVRVYVDVPETVADRIKLGGKAMIRLPSLRNGEFPGKVTRTSWMLSGESRTLRTEVDLPNPDGRIRPGMYAFASIPVEVGESLTIPATAVFIQDETPWCYFVESGKARRCQLRIGQRDKEFIEVTARRNADGTWQPIRETDSLPAVFPGSLTDGQEIVPK